MITESEVVGKGLKLWHGYTAMLREAWVENSRLFLYQQGYSGVVTPHVCKKETMSRFAPFLPPDRVRTVAARPEDDDPEVRAVYDECKDYDYLVPKNPLHVLMMGHQPLSYRDLPVRYFEFGESYWPKDGGVVNHLGLWLTTACDPARADEERAKSYGAVMQMCCEPVFLRQAQATVVTLAGEIQYVTEANAKQDAAFVFAWATFGITPRERNEAGGSPA